MTNEFNFGVTHNSIDIDELGNKLTRTASGITLPLLYPGAVQKDFIPGFNFTGTHITNSFAPVFTSVGDAPFVNFNTLFNWSDNLTKIWGTHIIKTGVFFERSRKDQTSFGNNNGQYNFGDNPPTRTTPGMDFLTPHWAFTKPSIKRKITSMANTVTGTSRVSCRTPGK